MTDTTPRPRRWLHLLLIVSLGLNLVMIGLALGAVLRFQGPEGIRAAPRSPGLALYHALPDRDRALMRRAMRDTGDRPRHAAMDDIVKALQAVPFDPDALESTLLLQASGREETARNVQRVWLERVVAMTDSERTEYARKLARISRRAKDRWH